MKKLSNQKGLSLTELLATVALVGLLGSMIVGIIPGLKNVLGTVTTKARGEMLLNNTVIVLRDYFRYADNLNCPDDKSCEFTGNDNWEYELSKDESDHNWITVTPRFVTNGSTDDSRSELGIDSTIQSENGGNWHILTDQAASRDLVPTFDKIKYEDGVIKISGLCVVKKNNGISVADYRGGDGNKKVLSIRPLKAE